MRDGVSIQPHEKRKNIIMPSEFLAMPNLSLVLKVSSFSATKITLLYKKRANLNMNQNDTLQKTKNEIINAKDAPLKKVLGQEALFDNYII